MLAGLLLVACDNGRPSAAPRDAVRAQPSPPRPSAVEMAALGRHLFFDRGLSASGRQSCADCHDPGHAFAPGNTLAVQPGGADMTAQGLRAVPSLRYLQSVPAFTEHHFDDDGDDSVDQGAAGGYTWDGRAPTRHAQAALPLFSAGEMANASPAQVAWKTRNAAYAGDFRRLFGTAIFDRPEDVLQQALMALEVFQQNPADFYPYTSKYDAFLRGQVTLSRQETRGLALRSSPHFHPIASQSAYPAEPASTGTPIMPTPRMPIAKIVAAELPASGCSALAAWAAVSIRVMPAACNVTPVARMMK